MSVWCKEKPSQQSQRLLPRAGPVTEGPPTKERVPALGGPGWDQFWAISHVTRELIKNRLLGPGQELLIQQAGEFVFLTLCEGF